MSMLKNTLCIKEDEYQTEVFPKRDQVAALMVWLPAGFEGILAVMGSSTGAADSFYPIRDRDNKVIRVDPVDHVAVLPCWFVVNTDIYAAHFLRFESYVDATLAEELEQSADIVIEVMGIFT